MRKSVLEYLENTMLNFSNKIAIRSGGIDLTFGSLQKSAKLLGYLIHQKLRRTKQPIVILLSKSIYSLIAFIGALFSGNIYVPIDIAIPIGRIKSIIDDLDNPLIITSDEHYEYLKLNNINSSNIILIQQVLEENDGCDEVILTGIQDAIIDTDPAYIIFTSGSTGKPKGVVVSHRSIIDYIDWAVECFHIASSEVIGNQSPFNFDNSTLDLFLTLATGATLVIIPEQLFAFPVRLMEFIVANKINFIFWVPSVLINVANLKALDYIDCSCLKKILFAGEVMPNRHLNYWRLKLPEALYANLYGPTEITVDCTYYIVNRSFSDQEPLPIGFPCRNTDILLLNQENKIAGTGEIGELCVRGSSLALGYWKDFDKSSEVFIQNPQNYYYFDRIYKTGDLVYLNDIGEIIFIGRKDTQIKHLGYRIELGEIESAILSLEGIKQACVLYNQEKNEITLFYAGNEWKEREIRKTLAPLLPKYMLPSRFYRFEKLPLNTNGKIDRRQLNNILYNKQDDG
jgi:amino acid adenylation domain-containing protein